MSMPTWRALSDCAELPVATATVARVSKTILFQLLCHVGDRKTGVTALRLRLAAGD